MSSVLAASGSSNNGFFDGVHNFFHSSTWLVIRNLALFLVVVFWLSTAYWVYKDAKRRIEDPWIVAMATILGLVPFLGPLIYMLFRPPEYLDDVRERELEIRAMQARLRDRQHCPVCRAEVDTQYLICPVCTTRLKQACASCKAPLEPLWQVCPYCETPIERRPVDLTATLDNGDGAADTLAGVETRVRTPRGGRRRRSAE
jgi:RNA polymerase subunit RPABC4/transcription elongation factor Spt4